MSLSNYAAQALLNSFLGRTSNFGDLETPPDLYVALFTTKPNEAGGSGTEVSGGGYARVATTSSDWTDASNADPSEASNAEEIDFGTTSGSWGTVVAVGFFDALTDGNFLGAFNLDASKTINNGDAVKFPVGELKLRFR